MYLLPTVIEAQQAFEDTIKSEAILEVDRNKEAKDQISECANRIKNAVLLRYDVAKQSTDRVIDDCNLALNSPPDDECQIDYTAFSEIATEPPHYESDVSDNAKLAKYIESIVRGTDAKSVCKGSRNLRCEIVYFYILGLTQNIRGQLESAIDALRAAILRLKDLGNVREEYVRNIEYRTGCLELLYERVFRRSYRGRADLPSISLETRLLHLLRDAESTHLSVSAIGQCKNDLDCIGAWVNEVDEQLWSISNSIDRTKDSRQRRYDALEKINGYITDVSRRSAGSRT